MSQRIGMDPVLADEVARTIAALSARIDGIQDRVAWARLLSINPVSPGTLILAPVSQGVALSAVNNLNNARAQLEYLTTRLAQEAQQQREVSGSLRPGDPGWFAPPPSATRPGDESIWETAWNEFWGTPWDIISGIDTVVGLVTGTLEVLDEWWRRAPRWVTTAAEWAARGGKVLPWVGLVIGGVSTVVEWDEDYVWGNARNIVGNILDIASVVSLIPPLTVASPFIAAGSVVWDLFDLGWDFYDEDPFGWW